MGQRLELQYIYVPGLFLVIGIVKTQMTHHGEEKPCL